MTSIDLDLWAYDGSSAIKTLDDSGRFEGLAVPFGDADASRMRDIFTAETNFGRAMKSGSDLLYFHGLPEIPTSVKSADAPRQANPLADMVIGEATYKTIDAGVWMTGQLRLGNEYEAKVWEMVKAGKLGLSTGAAAHRVRRVAGTDGTNFIKAWNIDEVSLTPIPAHPRTSVYALKSLIEGSSGLTSYDRVSMPSAACPECGGRTTPLNGQPGKLKCVACGSVSADPQALAAPCPDCGGKMVPEHGKAGNMKCAMCGAITPGTTLAAGTPVLKSIMEGDAGMTSYDRVGPPMVPCPKCGGKVIPAPNMPGKLKCTACGIVFTEPKTVPCPNCGGMTSPILGEPGKLKCAACGVVFNDIQPATKSLHNGEEPAESVGFVECLKRAESALEKAMRMPDLNAAKASAIKSLWETHKRYRDGHVDAEKVRAAIETANRLNTRFKG